ncbi:Methyltransferase-like protein 17, mitochondrial [Glycine soja]
MAAQTIAETAQKILTPETLRYAAKQSARCLVVPVRLRRAIKKYLREQEEPYMKRKVLRLSQTFNQIKDVNLQLASTTAKKIVEDPFEQSKRWKITSSYGDIGLIYRDEETNAYVASRMPAVYSACYRVLKEVRRRLPGFSPSKVLDFGAGTGSAFWALQEVWPKSLEKVNLIEPSQSMQRAGRSLMQGLKNLPLIHSYDSIQSLSKSITKSEREHDLVIALMLTASNLFYWLKSYVLGEIPSIKDRITIVRQLWDLTRDILVLVEPGTPHGSNIIAQMRSHILWMEERKYRKSSRKNNEVCKDLITEKAGAFVVAPCPHDGACPLVKSGKYCHFVQRLERTSSQRAYKRSKRDPLRGFEDEKFSYVVFRRGSRPRQVDPWPLDGMEFETLKEQHAKRNPEDLEIDYEDWLKLQQSDDTPHEVADAETDIADDLETDDAPREVVNAVTYDSDDAVETDGPIDSEEDEEREEERGSADLGGGWGRIVFMPVRRGRQVTMNVCRSTKRDASEGSYDRIVVTRTKNPTLHQQAKRSIWGDLWPC